MYFYVEDETMHISEVKSENSGMAQGAFLKRHKVPKPDGSLYTVTPPPSHTRTICPAARLHRAGHTSALCPPACAHIGRHARYTLGVRIAATNPAWASARYVRGAGRGGAGRGNQNVG